MAQKICKKCGKPLDENTKGKCCKDCKKKKKKTLKLISAAVITAGAAVGGYFLWNSQPEFVKKAIIKKANKKAAKAKADLNAKYEKIKADTVSYVNESKALIKKIDPKAAVKNIDVKNYLGAINPEKLLAKANVGSITEKLGRTGVVKF